MNWIIEPIAWTGGIKRSKDGLEPSTIWVSTKLLPVGSMPFSTDSAAHPEKCWSTCATRERSKQPPFHPQTPLSSIHNPTSTQLSYPSAAPISTVPPITTYLYSQFYIEELSVNLKGLNVGLRVSCYAGKLIISVCAWVRPTLSHEAQAEKFNWTRSNQIRIISRSQA